MKYMIILLFLVLLAQGINANNKKERKSFLLNEWCINTKDIEKWNMVDMEGKSYLFSQEDLDNLSKDEFEWVTENLRVKAVLFLNSDSEKD